MNLLLRHPAHPPATAETIPPAPLDLSRMEVEKRAALFRYMLDAAPDGVLCIDFEGKIVLVNPMMETIFGYAPMELIGQSLEVLLPGRFQQSHKRQRQEHQSARRSRPMGSKSGLTGRRKNGEVFPVDVSIGVPVAGQEGYTVAFIRDISERQRHEEMMLHQATHDRLTGLPNRWLFLDRLRQAIASARRENSRVAVLMLDLDNFKTVNDSFGDAFGDEILLDISARIRGLLREEDTLARLGGDEFGILLSHMDRPDETVQVAEKILLSFAAPCTVNKQSVIVGGSLGISFFPEDGADGETLLRFADVAMYQAKSSGRGIHVTFFGSMDQRLQDDLHLHVRLKHAIDVGALVLHYQPQVDTQTGEIVGCEALLRWCDDELGNVSPARFIPLAETTGLILPIGDWVIETACRQIAMWYAAGTPLKVAVNLSPRQLRDRKVVEKITRALDVTGARPELLEIEITETAMMENLELAQKLLANLGDLGIGISLDDFGTGYSSLGSLKDLPITKLKIDQSFVRNLPGDGNDVALVRTIIGLAKNLNLGLVAEGVETHAQRVFLHHSGCETCQGWLFSKAVSAAQMGQMLNSDAKFDPISSAVPPWSDS